MSFNLGVMFMIFNYNKVLSIFLVLCLLVFCAFDALAAEDLAVKRGVGSLLIVSGAFAATGAHLNEAIEAFWRDAAGWVKELVRDGVRDAGTRLVVSSAVVKAARDWITAKHLEQVESGRADLGEIDGVVTFSDGYIASCITDYNWLCDGGYLVGNWLSLSSSTGLHVAIRRVPNIEKCMLVSIYPDNTFYDYGGMLVIRDGGGNIIHTEAVNYTAGTFPFRIDFAGWWEADKPRFRIQAGSFDGCVDFPYSIGDRDEVFIRSYYRPYSNELTTGTVDLGIYYPSHVSHDSSAVDYGGSFVDVSGKSIPIYTNLDDAIAAGADGIAAGSSDGETIPGTVDSGILARIWELISNIWESIKGIWESIKGIPMAIVGDFSSVDYSALQGIGVTDKFPFSLPWDLHKVLSIFDVPEVNAFPTFEVNDFFGASFAIQVPSDFLVYAGYVRWALLVAFDLGIIWGLRQLMGGAV